MAISFRPISREKKTAVMLFLMAADLAKSNANVRLADGRAGGDNDHLAAVQALGQLVEFVETGGNAGHAFATGTSRLDFVDGAFDDVAQRHVVFRGAAFGDLVDLGLGFVDDRVDFAVLRVAKLDDLGSRINQSAQHRALANDLGVEAGVGSGRDGLDQGVQVGRAANAGDFPALGQEVGDRHGVGGFAAAVEVDDRFVDRLRAPGDRNRVRAGPPRSPRWHPWRASCRRARFAPRRDPEAACGRRLNRRIQNWFPCWLATRVFPSSSAGSQFSASLSYFSVAGSADLLVRPISRVRRDTASLWK